MEHVQLLREYAESGDESAFSELVGRYIDLVYSIALRQMGGDAHLAEDVVQTVFLDLARKAPSLTEVSMLGGWLHRHTCFVASNLQRTERRRQAREKNNEILNTMNPDPNDPELQLKSCLDEAIEALEPNDREAVLLRFFEKQSLRDIGRVFGSSEDAAQKRVSRAVNKLRDLLLKRGVAVSGVALLAHLTANAVSSAPSSLSSSVSHYVREALMTAPSATATEVVKISVWSKAALVAALVTFLGALFFWPSGGSDGMSSEQAGNSSENHSTEPAAQANETSSPFNTLMASQSNLENSAIPESEEPFQERMELTIIGKESGKPVAGALIDYRGWEDQTFTKHQFFSNEQGVAEIDVPYDTITHLELTVRIDGYADTKLDWRTDRGEQVPLFYTLELDPGIAIGGVVQDPDGNPIANAKVGFNHEQSAATVSRPESHEFGWIEVETDANGRWRINRIGVDMIPRLYGGARHPEYVGSSLFFLSQEPASESLLRNEEHVFTLNPAAKVSGIVLAPDNTPIDDAKVLVGSIGSGNSRETKTEADGTFRLSGCKPGIDFVTASAPGFAATTIRTEIVDGLSSLELRLQFSKILRLRVVDYLDRPVAGANVWLNTISHFLPSDESHTPMTQVEFSEKTDRDGRVVWNEAPDKEMLFDFAAQGHMRVDEFEARPSEEEYLVKLPPALEVYGTVRDAETLNPIDSFSILAGYPGARSKENEVQPSWSGLGRHRMMFSGGKFLQVFQEAIIGGIPNPGYILKIESEGYEPYITRVIAPDEIQVPFDILLERGEVTTVRTFLPDGQIAVAADIGLALGSTSYAVGPGRISRNSNGSIITTDVLGQFNLPSDDSIRRVIVAHPEGFAEIDPDVAREEKQIRLTQWGALSGQYVSKHRETHNKISLRSIYGYSYPYHTSDTYTVILDEEGRFQMDKVPPGKYTLSWRIEHDSPQGKSWSYKNIMPVNIQPGEILDLTLDFGSAQFQLVWPEGLERNDSWNVYAILMTPGPQVPEEYKGNPDAFNAWASQPEIQAMSNSVISQSFAEQADDLWLAHDVVPSDSYTLHVWGTENSGSPQNADRIASAQKEVRIPSQKTDAPVDLGVIQLELVNP